MMNPRLACALLRLLLLLALTNSLTMPASAANYGWDRGGGNNVWSAAANWDPNGVPGAADNIVLTSGSAAGPQVIDLSGDRQIHSITKDGAAGEYTFTNLGGGALEILASGQNGIVPAAGAGAMTFDTDIQLAATDDFVRFNVVAGADAVVVNGGIESSAASGTTTLELTSRDLSLNPSVLVSGVISDGSSGARIAVDAGFENDSEHHRGVIELTGLNTYTGATAVHGATLRVNSLANPAVASALGAPTTVEDATIHLGARDTIGISKNVSGTLVYTGSGHRSKRAFGLLGAGGAIHADASATGSLELSGGASAASSGLKAFELGGASSTSHVHRFNGVIADGVGTVELVKTGASVWVLGAKSTYSGDTRVEQGHLWVTSSGRLPDATTVTVDSGATLLYAISSADAIYGLQGDGVVDLRSSTLVLGNSAGPAQTGGVGEFSGEIVSVASTGNLEKRGGGVFTFAGTGTYLGFTEIENGQMLVTGEINSTNEVRVVDGPLDGGGLLTLNGGSITNSGATSIDAGAKLEVSGAGSVFTQTGATMLDVAGDLLVEDAGQFSTSTGLTTVTGTITRVGTGVLDVNGSLLIDGGNFLTPGGDFDRAAGQELTLHNGGQLNATPPKQTQGQAGAAGGAITTAETVALVNGTIRVDGSRSDVSNAYQGGSFDSSGVTNLSGTSLISLQGGDAYRTPIRDSNGSGGVGGSFTSAGSLQLNDTSSINLNGGDTIPQAIGNSFAGRGGNGGMLTSSGTTELLGESTIMLKGGAGDSYDNGIGHLGGDAGTFQVAGGTTRLAESTALHLVGGRGGVGSLVGRGGRGGAGGELIVSAGQLTLDGASVLLGGGAGNRTNGGGHAGDGGGAGTMQVRGGVVILNSGAVRLQGGQGGQNPSWSIPTAGGDGGNGGVLTVSGGDFTLHDGTLSLTPGNGGAGIGAEDGAPGAPGVIEVVSGAFRQNGGHVTTGVFRLADQTLHYFQGGRLTVDTFDGNLVMLGGTFTPGATRVVTSVTGSLTGSSGAVVIELLDDGGVAGVDFDQIAIAGNADFSGDLSIDLAGGFAPQASDSFTVLTASNVLVPFSNVAWGGRLTEKDGWGSFSVDLIGGDSVVLSGWQTDLPGDYNNDGSVDAADYSVWRDNQGAPAGTLINDADGGPIGAAQYATWRANYGATLPLSGALASTSTPEPGALLAILVGGVIGARLRQRRYVL